MKKLLKGGTVVSGSGSIVADVLIDGEKIEAIGLNLPEDGAEVVNVSGKLLFPGFIDAHTHFDLDVCNTTTADDFYTGTRSAIRGGTIVGEHSVMFCGRDEVIEIKHSALSREVFATGAVNAAAFLAAQTKPGLYNMSDVIAAQVAE